MEFYNSKTKTELIKIIHELERQNEILSSQLSTHNSSTYNTENTFSSVVSNTFKDNAPETALYNHPTTLSDNDFDIEKANRLHFIMNAVLDNVPVFLFMKDTGDDFKYIYWNKRFCDYAGISYDEAMGRNDFEIFPNADMETFYQEDLRALRDGYMETITEYTALSGEIRTTKTIKLLVPSSGDHPYILGISWDLTDVMKLKQELVAARLKAEESDELKMAFLTNMTHEIRTPLNSIMGFSQLMSQSDVRSEQLIYANIIENNSVLLLNIFNDILDLSSLQAGTLDLAIRRIVIKDICDKLYTSHIDSVRQGVTLSCDDVDPELTVESDWGRLVQICNHLMTNALKFTHQGSINFGVTQKEDNIEFYIKDTGVGIEDDRKETIFKYFNKGDKCVQGTGLGLPICRILLEKMGGEIWLESVVGEGSTFYFSIPKNADFMLS